MSPTVNVTLAFSSTNHCVSCWDVEVRFKINLESFCPDRLINSFTESIELGLLIEVLLRTRMFQRGNVAFLKHLVFTLMTVASMSMFSPFFSSVLMTSALGLFEAQNEL